TAFCGPCVLSCDDADRGGDGHERDLHSFPTRRSSDLSLTRSSVAPRTTVSPCAHAAATNSTGNSSIMSATCASGTSMPRSGACRSEEHTSELQSRENLVCGLLREKKKQEADEEIVVDS